MRTRTAAAATAAALVAAVLGGCGTPGRDGSRTLTYWASNQGADLGADRRILRPELAEFQRRTGIKVKLEVVPWSDLLSRILTAAASGRGPDVVNIGNTWSASLQATGAFIPFDSAALAKVGGRSHFLAAAMASTGAPGRDPVAVPLYGLAYGLYYNKHLFAAAGLRPPADWAELISAGKRLTDPAHGRWGLSVEGASYTENAHFAFIFGKQHGAELFRGSTPLLDSPQLVAGVKQYVDLVGRYRIANPSSVEYANDTPFIRDFATGRAAMVMLQSNGSSAIEADGMKPADYGVVPIPLPDPLPPGGQRVTSLVAGINIAAFTDSRDHDGALRLIRFLTSTEEQQILNKAFGSLPVTPAAYDDPVFRTPTVRVFRQVLATTAAPLPMIPEEAQFETLVGNAVRELLAAAASGATVDDTVIRARLAEANSQMQTGP
ncbi:ABC transporter substrate-binding protein [Streptomyces sp. NPDC092296]|uniref:ABC transporter substrate-binding protein n=1 Tax=Streptomyces sp. NPDC092296 TaxID=3366012 RepID=UPI0037F1BD55